MQLSIGSNAVRRAWAAGTWTPAETRLWLAALALHVVAALFSHGYYHFDEHFQILEAAHAKLNGTESTLTWEFQERMRPWLQPAVSAWVIAALRNLGVMSPFIQATVLRLLSALAGWVSLVVLARACRGWITGERGRLWLVGGLSFAWLLPYLHARTSSENLATILFWLGAAVVIRRVEQKATAPWQMSARVGLVTAGIVLGLAFYCRFQVGIMIAGLGLWLILQRRFGAAALTIAGLGVGLGVGILIDRWGYGAWTPTAWNYAYVNVVEGRAAQWGRQPWWWYFAKVSSRPPFPLGFVALLAVPLAWLMRPRHVLTCISLPYFALHVALAHKELRFLFPIAPAVVPLVVMAVQDLTGLWPQFRQWEGPRLRRVVGILLIPNFVYLAGAVLLPAKPEVDLLAALYAHSPNHLDLFTLGPNPYQRKELSTKFYAPREVEIHQVPSYTAFAAALEQSRTPTLLYVTSNALPAEADLLRERCRIIYQTYPNWVSSFNFGDWMSRTFAGLVVECT